MKKLQDMTDDEILEALGLSETEQAELVSGSQFVFGGLTDGPNEPSLPEPGLDVPIRPYTK